MTQDRRALGARNFYILPRSRAWRPPTDVYETDEAVVVKVEIPGLSEREISVTVADRRLVISGTRPEPAQRLSYHNMEIHYGPFRTEVQMAWSLEEDAIDASYDSGFLYVKLPKARARRVTVS